MMKWSDAKNTLDQAQRDGVTTLGGLRAWLMGGRSEPPATVPVADTDDDALQAFLEQVKRDFESR